MTVRSADVARSAGDGGRGKPSADQAVSAQWLARIYELGRPASHEVRNALNGIAVNLEVVRMRAAREDAMAASLLRFADAAIEQLDVLAALSEVLLSFMRPLPEPVDLADLVQRLGTLLGAIARSEGGTVLVTIAPSSLDHVTSASGEPVRVAVTAMLLAAFDGTGALACELTDAPQPTLRLRRDDGALPPLPDDVAELLTAAGARIDSSHAGWVAVFPPFQR